MIKIIILEPQKEDVGTSISITTDRPFHVTRYYRDGALAIIRDAGAITFSVSTTDHSDTPRWLEGVSTLCGPGNLPGPGKSSGSDSIERVMCAASSVHDVPVADLAIRICQDKGGNWKAGLWHGDRDAESYLREYTASNPMAALEGLAENIEHRQAALGRDTKK